ncbi:cation:proton antiporter [Saccharopolyspora shandongensis]|uniref:cation:proton antiporter domain-containing protein n=1 Tax=Saccharopolyspora shandongensis TaxID=418495 RepID=UPI003440520F
MPSFGNLLILTIIAFLASLLLGLAPRLRIPSVVLEIVAGVIVGPSVLGLVGMDQAVQIVALLGLAFLLFLAGLEVDLHRLRGSLLRVALIGYVVSLAIAVTAGFSFGAAGWVRGPMLIAVALSATSLGLVVSARTGAPLARLVRPSGPRRPACGREDHSRCASAL